MVWKKITVGMVTNRMGAKSTVSPWTQLRSIMPGVEAKSLG